jgi:chaperonin cofactor prefoldin
MVLNLRKQNHDYKNDIETLTKNISEQNKHIDSLKSELIQANNSLI